MKTERKGIWHETSFGGERIYEFWAPVIGSEDIREDAILLEAPLGGSNIPKEPIGYVVAALSLRGLDAATRVAVRGYIVILIAFIPIGLLVAFFLTRRVIGPIRRLVKVTEAVGSGDLTQRVDVRRGDELGRLTLSFNRMIATLKERDEDIKRHQDKLIKSYRELDEKTRLLEEEREKLTRSLKEKEVLLKEVHHRVKNNMQVISSMLRLQSKRYLKKEEEGAILKESQDRIRSIALVHEKLYRSEDLAEVDFRDYLKTLAKGLLRSYGMGKDRIALKIDVEDILLGIDKAIPCGLIVNELVSNSLKHAFPGGRKGEIRIAMRKIKDLQSKTLELIVSDNGIGMPEGIDPAKTESLGLQLVTTLADQLHGSMELNTRGGTEFRIRFEDR